MRWLLERMMYELEDVKEYSAYEKIIDKYANMAKIQAQVKYGAVYTIEDFIDSVECGCFTSYDGNGYYWDEVENKENTVSLNVNELRRASKKYHYVIWYNR